MKRMIRRLIPYALVFATTTAAVWWLWDARWILPLTPRIRGTRPGG